MKGVAIAGIGMTQFGKQVGRGVRSLALAAIEEAIADSGLASDRIDRIYFGNAISGIISQQEMVRGASRASPSGARKSAFVQHRKCLCFRRIGIQPCV